MSAFDKMFGEDRVYSAILDHLRVKRSRQGFKFNCPMCNSRGESSDKRERGGMGYDATGLGISCFNCGFKTRFVRGQFLSKNMKAFLAEIGVPTVEIKRLSLWAHQMRSVMSNSVEVPQSIFTMPSFPPRDLPEGARSIEAWANDGCEDPDFLEAIEYLYSRGSVVAEATTYYWTPLKKSNLNHRIIVPCFYENEIVGWTGRAVRDDIIPKYYNDTPPNFLFNSQALTNPNRKIAVLVEGIFDAIAIDAVSALGSRLNETQINWIGQANKRIITLPDRDRAGKKLIDCSVRQGWEVAFPRSMHLGSGSGWWDVDVKDAAAATEKYGRLYTLRSILESSTNSRLKIEFERRNYTI